MGAVMLKINRDLRKDIMTSPLPTSRCIDCGLHKICFPPSFEPAALEQLGNLINAQKVLNKGESIYRQGDSASAIYAVRSGALKTVMTQADGSTQVTGFYLPGEVIGLDNLAQSHCASTAIATEKAGLCELPVHAMSKLSQQLPELQSHLFQIMSTEIRADYQRMHMLSQTSAEERLVSFLLSWSARQTRRRLSADALRLTMTREDLANYLGLALETVSRSLHRLQADGMIAVAGRQITLLDQAGLHEHLQRQCS